MFLRIPTFYVCLSIVFSIISCHTETDDSVVPNSSRELEFMNSSLNERSSDGSPSDSEYENTRGDIAALLLLQTHDGTSLPNYVTQTYSSFETIDKSLGNLVGFAVNRSGYTITSEGLHTLVTNYMVERELDPLSFNSIYAHNLQKASFEIGHRAAFKEPSSANRDNLIIHYLKVAVAQKAVDTDAMTDMFLEVESQLEQSFKTQARQYILGQSQANLNEALVELEKYHDEFLIQGQSYWDSPTTRVNVLHFKDMYEAAQDAISRL